MSLILLSIGIIEHGLDCGNSHNRDAESDGMAPIPHPWLKCWWCERLIHSLNVVHSVHVQTQYLLARRYGNGATGAN